MSGLLYPHFFCRRFSKITRAKGEIYKYIVVMIQRPRRVLPPSVGEKQSKEHLRIRPKKPVYQLQ